MMVILATGPANLAIVKHAHASIKETSLFALGRGRIRHLTHRTFEDFFRTKDAELDRYDLLGLGGSGEIRHASSVFYAVLLNQPTPQFCTDL